MMNTYEKEQHITDKYGTVIINQIAATFFDNFNIERVTDRDTQIKGIDYYFWKKTDGRAIKIPVDLKFDFYDNHNFALELFQQYQGAGEESWVHHNGNIYIGYVKIALRRVYLMKLADLQQFMKTETFQKRKSFETNFRINGKPGQFKNFRMEELPVDRIIHISLMINPWETDDILAVKPSLTDAVLYRDE
jgi:hypothetical protein